MASSRRFPVSCQRVNARLPYLSESSSWPTSRYPSLRLFRAWACPGQLSFGGSAPSRRNGWAHGGCGLGGPVVMSCAAMPETGMSWMTPATSGRSGTMSSALAMRRLAGRGGSVRARSPPGRSARLRSCGQWKGRPWPGPETGWWRDAEVNGGPSPTSSSSGPTGPATATRPPGHPATRPPGTGCRAHHRATSLKRARGLTESRSRTFSGHDRQTAV